MLSRTVLDAHGACEFLGGISIATIRKWCSQRSIPFIKLRARVLFRVSDLEQHLEKNLVKARILHQKGEARLADRASKNR
jgi:excisionase family DNA binding protein